MRSKSPTVKSRTAELVMVNVWRSELGSLFPAIPKNMPRRFAIMLTRRGTLNCSGAAPRPAPTERRECAIAKVSGMPTIHNIVDRRHSRNLCDGTFSSLRRGWPRRCSRAVQSTSACEHDGKPAWHIFRNRRKQTAELTPPDIYHHQFSSPAFYSRTFAAHQARQHGCFSCCSNGECPSELLLVC